MAEKMGTGAAGGGDLAALLQENETQIEKLGTELIRGDVEACVGTLVGLVASFATGSPLMGAFATAGVARAFADTATTRLLAEFKAYEHGKALEQARRAFMNDLGDQVEALLGQALLQLVRVDHNIKDEVLEALGGLRGDLADFRQQFAAAIPETEREAVRIELQEVSAGGLGIHVSNSSRQRAFVVRQTVTGPGAVGIKLNR